MWVHTHTGGHKKSFGGDKYYYLDCGDDFMDVCLCPNTSNSIY